MRGKVGGGRVCNWRVAIAGWQVGKWTHSLAGSCRQLAGRQAQGQLTLATLDLPAPCSTTLVLGICLAVALAVPGQVCVCEAMPGWRQLCCMHAGLQLITPVGPPNQLGDTK